MYMANHGIDFEKEQASIMEQLSAELSNPVKGGFVPPFMGKADIKLVVIGQDPTIKNEQQREKIKCTLNLDKAGALRRYIEEICNGLGIGIENVYATNLFKYFYSVPPAKTFDVLKKHLQPNLRLLKKELSVFPSMPIITLGEPLLKLLVNDKAKVRDYWGYDSNTHASNGIFKFVSDDENRLDRVLFPFCHQPSLRKAFYKDTLVDYIQFVRKTSKND